MRICSTIFDGTITGEKNMVGVKKKYVSERFKCWFHIMGKKFLMYTYGGAVFQTATQHVAFLAAASAPERVTWLDFT